MSKAPTSIRLLFRADGNSQTGLGHLYRIFALMEIYKENYDCFLITKSTSSTEVIPKEYEWRVLPDIDPADEVAWLVSEYSPAIYRLVADGYQFDGKYQQKIKDAGFFMIYIDDLVNKNYFADVVINHSFGVGPLDYQIKSDTRLALGAEYALLRPAFLALAAGPVKEKKRRENAFVCFGGADPENLAEKAVLALERHPQVKRIELVVGAAYASSHADEIKKLSDKVTVRRNLDAVTLASIMESSDFAVSSASTVLYELCAAKVPVMAGYYVQNQVNLYKGCLEKGAIFGCGNLHGATTDDFGRMLSSFMDVKDWGIYQRVQQRLFDGKIRQRFLSLVEKVTYRPAAEDDMELIYNWSSDQVVRANSYATEPISIEVHKAWFERKMKDSSVRMFIAEVEGVPAGFVRYEAGTQEAVVGVIVDSVFRGRDYSPLFLKDTARLFFRDFDLPVTAFIKSANTASVRAFEKAGYIFKREDMVKGTPSFVYELTKGHAE